MVSLSSNTNASTQTLVFSTDPNPLGTMADVPPFIPGAKALANNVYGVNRNMVNSDRRGLLGYFLPYPAMDSLDSIQLRIGTPPRPVGAPIPVGLNVDKPVPFYLPTDLLNQLYSFPIPMPDALPLVFTVTRPSGNTNTSPPLPLLFKPFGPGEADTRPDLPNNQGLALPIPSETVIDKPVLDNGMIVTVPQYLYQAIGDTVYLMVGPLVVSVTVSALGDVFFDLPPDFLARLPNTDKVPVSYEIVDLVENGSGWSSAVMLSLKPTDVLLAAPLVDEADAANNLDYSSLAGAAATVLLTDQFSIGDYVVLTIALFTSGGDRVEHAIERTVAANSRLLQIPLPNELIRNVIKGLFTLSYTKERGTIIQNSKSATVTVSASKSESPAAAPTITEQQGGELPADTPLAHVVIPRYWPLVNGATITMIWQITGSDGVVNMYMFSQFIVDATQEVVFTVLAEYIERFPGKPLIVTYKIEKPGAPSVQSEPLQLQIGAPQTQTPTITAAINTQTNQPVPDGGTTTAGSVTVSGDASANENLEIRNGTILLDNTTAGSNGTWRFTFAVSGSNSYQIMAKAQSGGQPVSNTWSFRVSAPLYLGPNHHLPLSNYFLVPNQPPMSPPAQGTYLRTASGGSGGFNYQSSNTLVARVNPTSGLITACGNGSATITVRDSSGQTASFVLTISGITLVTLGGLVSWPGYPNHIEGQRWRATALSVTEMAVFRAIYFNGTPVASFLGWPAGLYWSNTNNDQVGGIAYAYDLNATYDRGAIAHPDTPLYHVRKI
ncbi:hypothetical protein [Pseudomonas sp. MWU12-2029]|uniref:hypothetical protein n=1 Tax=Pseudomonas sp. MWU12-2029 TaxID=2927805 RepID=UPI00200BB41E|nr:hypothetical protein [Pseudomonas sp. MWU12-2029]